MRKRPVIAVSPHDQLLEKLSWQPTKEAAQFTIRAAVTKKLIAKTERLILRRGRKRVCYEVASEVPAPLSIATLYDSEETRTKVIPSMRSCEGIRKRACGHNLYLIISGSGVDRIVDSISSSITDYKQAAVNNSSANMRGLDKLKPTGPSGMVFED